MLSNEKLRPQFSSPTCEPWRTQTGEPPHSVLTGGSVPAGLGSALVHVDLTTAALEPRYAEAGVPVPTGPAYGPILARVWGAGVNCGGRRARASTFEQHVERLLILSLAVNHKCTIHPQLPFYLLTLKLFFYMESKLKDLLRCQESVYLHGNRTQRNV